MKKPNISLMILITCVFAAFTLGFFCGRNYYKDDIQISPYEAPSPSVLPVIADDTSTNPPETTEITDLIVNINTANIEELMLLPGIGEVYAQRIIDYRQEHGDYIVVEDLMNVKGIGTKRLEAILEMITVGGSAE